MDVVGHSAVWAGGSRSLNTAARRRVTDY